MYKFEKSKLVDLHSPSCCSLCEIQVQFLCCVPGSRPYQPWQTCSMTWFWNWKAEHGSPAWAGRQRGDERWQSVPSSAQDTHQPCRPGCPSRPGCAHSSTDHPLSDVHTGTTSRANEETPRWEGKADELSVRCLAVLGRQSRIHTRGQAGNSVWEKSRAMFKRARWFRRNGDLGEMGYCNQSLLLGKHWVDKL